MNSFCSLTVITYLIAASTASCNHDDCYRAVSRHQSTLATSFCKSYLDNTSISAPSSIATCEPSRISSACSYLLNATTTDPPTSVLLSSTAFNPSTCARNSIAACPTPYDPCCAYICAEAQVPFEICSPENETVLAQCSKCPSLVLSSSPPSTKPTTNPNAQLKITPTLSTLNASACTGRLLSTTACPTPYDPCCAWNCEEAQVPYNVCSQTDGSGEFAVCSQCPTPTV